MTLFDLPQRRQRIAQLEEQTARPDFWQDQEKARRIIDEMNALKGPVERYETLLAQLSDAEELLLLAQEEQDQQVAAEVLAETGKMAAALRNLELTLLLTGDYDDYNAIVALHPGAGGTEAQDWAEMLMRMYTRWAERKGFQVQVLDYLEGDEAGIKAVTLLVKGPNAYGFLRAEKGIHRLVRISPFDASGRRHTSFASVDVMPELKDDSEIEVKPDELRIDTFRAGGAGGQHVNKTDSAVRLTHLPTGIVVSCQNERSQHANRETAMRILKARLLELKAREREQELAAIRGEQGEIAWGNQIRSYVFHPYTMVKDHRTNHETKNLRDVMDGDLDGFIYAFLQQQAVGVPAG